MGKTKYFFGKDEKKYLIGVAWDLYLAEMYLAQKSEEVSKIKCDKCETIMERPVGKLLEDYQTRKCVEKLSVMFNLIEPELWKKKIDGKDLPNMVREVYFYLTGEKMESAPPPPDHKPAPKKLEPAKSSVDGALNIKDLVDKSKIKVTKVIPKNVNLKVAKK